LCALFPQDDIDAATIRSELEGPVPGSALPGLGSGESGSLELAVEHYLHRYFNSLEGKLPPAGLHSRILSEVERPLLAAALAATRGNQIRAAELLAMNRNTLRKQLRELDLSFGMI